MSFATLLFTSNFTFTLFCSYRLPPLFLHSVKCEGVLMKDDDDKCTLYRSILSLMAVICNQFLVKANSIVPCSPRQHTYFRFVCFLVKCKNNQHKSTAHKANRKQDHRYDAKTPWTSFCIVVSLFSFFFCINQSRNPFSLSLSIIHTRFYRPDQWNATL